MGLLKRILEWPARSITLMPVDFDKPWWDLLKRQRGVIIIALSYLAVDRILGMLLPIFFGWMFESKNVINLALITVVYLVNEQFDIFLYRPILMRLFDRTIESFHYGAYKYLLAVDPIYHIHRSSGEIIGKIRRTSQAYLDMLEVATRQIFPFIVEVGTVIVAALWLNWQLGFIVLANVLLFAPLFVMSMMRVTYDIEVVRNKQEDITNQLSAESLHQVSFIRASFATNSVRRRLAYHMLKLAKAESTLWYSYLFIRGIFVSLFIFSSFFVGWYLIYLIKMDQMSIVMGTAFIMTYFRGFKPILAMDKMVRLVLTAYRRLNDFYDFARTFGTQSFPVFPNDLKSPVVVKKDVDTIMIHANNITFAYPGKPSLFKDISFELTVKRDHNHLLYGIIGASGIGKTTFLSIIGGLLKPNAGMITINGIDIYAIDDVARQKLIAVQGQVATSMRGTLRYNLLFGLPESYHPGDQHLIEILHNVGLWNLFEAKEGLDTFIGEAGLNLSGGQRQRLNFANLYLRAQYYKPLLILIDEPTSSLDEVSEHALTRMIDQLARDSVTLVIAHRLKTLKEAHGLLDFSLFRHGAGMQFYTPNELESKSAYYKKLLAGVERIDV